MEGGEEVRVNKQLLQTLQNNEHAKEVRNVSKKFGLLLDMTKLECTSES